MRALEAALNVVWAMEEGALQTLLAIAAREHETTPEALEAYRAKSLANAERARVRNGVAIIDVIGATFKRANLMTAMSGATSYEMIRTDFQAALDDPKVKAILLNIDSPGGEASGIGELADAIFAARGQKPITAYVGGLGASAAYWMASAADNIVVDPTALLGSIGVKWAMRGDKPASDKDAPSYEFVSSVSPMKNADPGTKEGAAAFQALVDAMAGVFVTSVARNRGVDTETVLKDFGRGGIFVGMDAVQAGLADSLGSFETVLADLSAGNRKKPTGAQQSRKGTTMSDTPAEAANTTVAPPAAPAVDVNAAVASALTAERTRTAGLDRIAAAHSVPADILAKAKEDGTDVAVFALAVADLTAKATADKQAAALAALKDDDTPAAAAAPSIGEKGTDTVESVAAAIAAA